LSHFSLEKVVPVSVEVDGSGSVAGVPEDGFTLLGEPFSITATAEPGYVFDHWEGSVEGCEPTVEVCPYGAQEILAMFARELEFDGHVVRVLHDAGWAVQEEGGKDVLKPLGPYEYTKESRLCWDFDGAGVMTLNYSNIRGGHGDCLLDGKKVEAIEFQWDGDSSVSLEVVVPAGGGHRLELVFESIDTDVEPGFELLSAEWQSGVLVEVGKSIGGEVNGVVGERLLVPAGEVVELDAAPSPGYVFDGWSGDFVSQEAHLERVVWGPVNVLASFAKPIEGDAFFSKQVGTAVWNLGSDGLWYSPDDMEEGDFARLVGVVEGPCTLDLKIGREGGNEGLVQAYLDGAVVGQWASGLYQLDVPEGLHHVGVEMIAGSYGWYDSCYIESVEKEGEGYPVEISGGGFEIYSSCLERDGEVWKGLVSGGDKLEFSVSPVSGREFIEWTGDLEGEGESVSVEVNGPITARATCGLRSFVSGGVSWSVSPAGNAFMNGGVLGLDGTNEYSTVSAELEGPGCLSFANVNVEEVIVSVDGGVVDPVYGGQGFSYYPIDEGAHGVEVSIDLDMEHVTVDPNSSYAYQGLYYFSYTPGLPLLVQSDGAGEVVRNPEQMCYEENDVVHLSASPAEGNEFVGWGSSYSDKGEEFDLTMTEPVVLFAEFQAKESIGGLIYDYHGNVPDYSANTNGEGGSFSYILGPGYGEQFECSTVVEGPALLECSWGSYYSDSESLDVQLLVDSEIYDVSFTRQERLSLGAGSHEVSWKVGGGDRLEEVISINLGAPQVSGELEAYASSNGAEVSMFPEKDDYEYGEVVTLSAPELYEGIYHFLSWKDARGNLISTDPVCEYAIVYSGAISAVYSEFQLDIPGVDLIYADATGGWVEKSEMMGPNGGTVYAGKFNSILTLSVDEASVIHFKVKADNPNGSVFLLRGGSQVFQDYQLMEWRPFSVYLEAGEALQIEGFSSDDFLIADIEVSSGWGPTLLGVSEEELVFTPSLADAANGDQVSVAVASSVEDEFWGWMQDDGRVGLKTYSITKGGDDLVSPFITGAEYPAGVGSGAIREGWVPRLVYDEETATYRMVEWMSTLGAGDADGEHRLDLYFDEPCRFRFTVWDAFQDEAETSWEVLLDGVEVWGYSLNFYDQREYDLMIGPGGHRLSFVHPAASSKSVMHVAVDGANPGFYMRTRYNVGGGDFVVDSDEQYFDVGETVYVHARSNEGYEFDDWKGAYSGMAQGFVLEFTEDMEALPEPLFKPLGSRANLYGIDWLLSGAEVCVRDYLVEDEDGVDHVVSRPEVVSSDFVGTMQAEIVGPCVLYTSFWENLSGATLDGKSLHDPTVLSRYVEVGPMQYSCYLAIPSGKHVVKFRIPPWDGHVSEEGEIKQLPGFLVSAHGLGGEVDSNIGSVVTPGGTLAEVELNVPDEFQGYEWRGLPDDAVVDGKHVSFEVQDHCELEALVWKPVSVLGTELEHAGDGQWRSDAGSYCLSRMSYREHDVLRYEAKERGLIAYALDGDNSLSVRLNDEEVSYFDRGDEKTGFVQVGVGDVVEWYASRGWTSADDYLKGDMRFEKLRFHQSESLPGYFEWLLNYPSLSKRPPVESDPRADFDRDGVPNYVEYQQGTNPVMMDCDISLIPLRRNGRIYLSLPSSEVLNGRYTLYLSSSIRGPWNVVNSSHLGRAQVDEHHPNRVIRELLNPPGAGGSVFYRLRFSGYIPSSAD